MMERQAHEIPGGRLVVATLDGADVVCLKAERQGRDYLNHYLVPLDPMPQGRDGLTLVYIDPTEPVRDRADRFSLSLAAAEGAAEAAVGDVLSNAAGRFLKVFDEAAAQRVYAYVDVITGEIRRRQERTVAEVLTWTLVREA